MAANSARSFTNTVVETRASSFQNAPQVFQHARSLLGDAARDHLARGGVERNLAAAKHQAVVLDSLRIGANRLWGVAGRDNLLDD
jgi:hypothetical protein